MLTLVDALKARIARLIGGQEAAAPPPPEPRELTFTQDLPPGVCPRCRTLHPSNFSNLMGEV